MTAVLQTSAAGEQPFVVQAEHRVPRSTVLQTVKISFQLRTLPSSQIEAQLLGWNFKKRGGDWGTRCLDLQVELLPKGDPIITKNGVLASEERIFSKRRNCV